jgi:hypothetical protein
MTCRGTVRNGKIELEEGVTLPDGTSVRVEPIDARDNASEEQGVPEFFRAGEWAVPGAPSDLATNLDHYLYGHPKVVNDR